MGWGWGWTLGVTLVEPWKTEKRSSITEEAGSPMGKHRPSAPFSANIPAQAP